MKLIQHNYSIPQKSEAINNTDNTIDLKTLFNDMLPNVPFVVDERSDWSVSLSNYKLLLDNVFGVDTEVCRIFTNIAGSYYREVMYIPSSKIMLSTYMYSNQPYGNDLVEPHTTLDKLNLVGFIDIVYADTQENLLLIEKFFTERDTYKYNATPKNNNNTICTIESNKSGLILRKQTLDTSTYGTDIVEHNYNDDFSEAYDILTRFIEDDNCGLVLLDGEPGTGKSSLLMHLTTLSEELEKKFVFIPASFGHVLSSPDFLSFASNNLKDSVLIIEDAEEILKSRNSGSNSAVTNILNISDGILGKILKTKIIATLNKKADIDSALTRKGRLKLSYTFNPLSVEKSNKLLKLLGKDVVVDKPTVLTDLYNIDSINKVKDNEKQKKTIGFNCNE